MASELLNLELRASDGPDAVPGYTRYTFEEKVTRSKGRTGCRLSRLFDHKLPIEKFSARQGYRQDHNSSYSAGCTLFAAVAKVPQAMGTTLMLEACKRTTIKTWTQRRYLDESLCRLLLPVNCSQNLL